MLVLDGTLEAIVLIMLKVIRICMLAHKIALGEFFEYFIRILLYLSYE